MTRLEPKATCPMDDTNQTSELAPPSEVPYAKVRMVRTIPKAGKRDVQRQTVRSYMAISSKVRTFNKKVQREACYTDQVQVPVYRGGHMDFHFWVFAPTTMEG